MDVGRPIGEISPRIYGQYIEHVGDCVYPAIWDGGLRADVIDAARELGVPVVRWPGGSFADTYHWQDGVGPREHRPVRRNWQWGSTEPNFFGTDEFLTWCERVGAAPYVTTNLGTGTLDEALRWVDYCTGTAATSDVLRRRRNGRTEPYWVPLWGIGNETWGAWEAGTTTADDYARTVANWARFLKQYQPQAQVLGVGSSEGADPSWDRAVLEAAGGNLDFLTNHVYGYSVDRTTLAEYVHVAFTPVYLEARLRAMAATVQAHRESDHGIRIALDEWNIRHYVPDGANRYRLDRHSPRNVQDAVFAAGVLNALVRMSPTVGVANYVFLVNGNGVINVRGDQLVRTPLHYLFTQYRQWLRGTAVEVDVRGPTTATPRPQAGDPGHVPVRGGVPPRSPYLDVVAAADGAEVTLALVNRHPEAAITADLVLPGVDPLREAWTLTHEDVHAVNDFDHPDRVVPRRESVAHGTQTWTCPPHSVTLLRAGGDRHGERSSP